MTHVPQIYRQLGASISLDLGLSEVRTGLAKVSTDLNTIKDAVADATQTISQRLASTNDALQYAVDERLQQLPDEVAQRVNVAAPVKLNEKSWAFVRLLVQAQVHVLADHPEKDAITRHQEEVKRLSSDLNAGAHAKALRARFEAAFKPFPLSKWEDRAEKFSEINELIREIATTLGD